MTDPGGYANTSTAKGDTRSSPRLRVRIAVPGRAADAGPAQQELGAVLYFTDRLARPVRVPTAARVLRTPAGPIETVSGRACHAPRRKGCPRCVAGWA